MNRNTLSLAAFVLIHLAGALLVATGADRHPRHARPAMAESPDVRDDDESAYAAARTAWDEASRVHSQHAGAPRIAGFR